MLKKELLDTLSNLSPALGGAKSLVPVHPCFCFSGKEVFAYDDTAALYAKLEAPWKGAVRGAVLQAWLAAAGAKEVEAEVSESSLKLKCGRARAEFPILPESEFLFSLPDMSKAPKIPLTPAVLAAMTRASLAMGTDGQHPWRCGLQLYFVEGEVTVYACDNASAARAWVAGQEIPKALYGKAPLLPVRFVELLLARAGEGSSLYITDEWFAADLKDGVRMFGAVPGQTDLKTFQGLFADSSTNRKACVPLPKTWWGALTRAGVLLAGEKEAPAEFSAEGEKAALTTLSSLGNSKDSFKLEGAMEKTSARIPPAIALKAKDLVDKFMVTKGPAFFFAGDRFDFVVAAGA